MSVSGQQYSKRGSQSLWMGSEELLTVWRLSAQCSNISSLLEHISHIFWSLIMQGANYKKQQPWNQFSSPQQANIMIKLVLSDNEQTPLQTSRTQQQLNDAVQTQSTTWLLLLFQNINYHTPPKEFVIHLVMLRDQIQCKEIKTCVIRWGILCSL